MMDTTCERTEKTFTLVFLDLGQHNALEIFAVKRKEYYFRDQ